MTFCTKLEQDTISMIFQSKKKAIFFVINDKRTNSVLYQSNQYKNYKPFFTNMWGAINLDGGIQIKSFQIAFVKLFLSSFVYDLSYVFVNS